MSVSIEPDERLTKRDVERRLRDWRRRLLELYAQVEDWARDLSRGASVSRGAQRQLNEYVMRQFAVAPRQLPTLTVHCDGRTLEFAPSCLWIVGANGRVDVSADGNPYTLFDMGGEGGQPSDWQLVNRDPRILLEPFTREAFLRLVESG